jgi:hypothetical protein
LFEYVVDGSKAFTEAVSGMDSSLEAVTQVPPALLGSVSDGYYPLERKAMHWVCSVNFVSVGSSLALVVNTLGPPLVAMGWNGEEGNFWEEEGVFPLPRPFFFNR